MSNFDQQSGLQAMQTTEDIGINEVGVPATTEMLHSDTPECPKASACETPDPIATDMNHLHQTLDQMNQGIGEIAASMKALLTRTTAISGANFDHALNVETESVDAAQFSKASSRQQSHDRFRSRVSRRPDPDQLSSTSEASSFTDERLKPPSEIEPTVRICNWEQFMNRFSEDEGKSTLEVLVSGPDLEADIRRENHKRGLPELYGLVGSESRQGVPAGASDTHIQRVRIQSVAVMLLMKSLNIWENDSVWDDNPKTFLRPFRCFVNVQQNMKEGLQDLEAYLHDHPTLRREEKNEDNDNASDEMSTTMNDNPVPELPDDRPASLDLGETTTEHIATIPGALEQIRCYIKFVDDEILPLYHKFDDILEKKTYKVYFEDLSYVFRVGDLLYAPEKDTSQDHSIAAAQTFWRIFYVKVELGLQPREAPEAPPPVYRVALHGHSAFRVYCYYVDHDGIEFGTVIKDFILQPYLDERDVTILPFYPLRFASNCAELLEQARASGMKFIESINRPYGSYSGWTIVQDTHNKTEEDPKAESTKTPEHIDSDIIVDFKEGFNHNPTWRPRFSDLAVQLVRIYIEDGNYEHVQWSDSKRTERLKVCKEDIVLNDGIDSFESKAFLKQFKYLGGNLEKGNRRPEPEGDDIALLPRRIVGYALWERKFVRLDSRFLYLHHVAMTAEDNPFDKLKISSIHKTLIQSIVTEHFLKKDIEKSGTNLITQDLIRGKGKGVVILLHGVPGVGKTATAEAVAQRWGKPLFPITCGDLGSTADSVESSLNEIFRLAHLWDCVLLLDEADVFITQRTRSDLQRNALVSVFLRMMEYYNGILFLTTNRPGSLDEGVKSRVHLSLPYNALDLEQTKAIFQLNINQLQKIEKQRAEATNTAPMDIFDKEILNFAETHFNNHTNGLGRWNGRQIRNAFSIAASLAHFEASEKDGRAVQLRPEHFRQVQEATLMYDKYRSSVLSGSDGEIALQSEARNDDFGKHQPPHVQDSQNYRRQMAAERPAIYNQTQAQAKAIPHTPVGRQHGPYEPGSRTGGSSLSPGYGEATAGVQGGYNTAQGSGFPSERQGSYNAAQYGGYPQSQPEARF